MRDAAIVTQKRGVYSLILEQFLSDDQRSIAPLEAFQLADSASAGVKQGKFRPGTRNVHLST